MHAVIGQFVFISGYANMVVTSQHISLSYYTRNRKWMPYVIYIT